MRDNIDLELQRGAKLDDLEAKAGKNFVKIK
jgi:hypothetical protein